MRIPIYITAATAALVLLAGSALADWEPGDGHKMHYPQLPDPYGWDIDMTSYILADDWQCSASGPVDDIHFWYSVMAGDHLVPPHFMGLTVSIHSNVPAEDNPFGFYSMPGDLLWSRTYSGPFRINGPWVGEQGWDDPQPYDVEPICEPFDHNLYWQVNLTDIDDPFVQEEGEIYWLDLQVYGLADPYHPVGWKTTLDPFQDDAVYANPQGGMPPWLPIAVCDIDMPTDLAFVITPEPTSLALLAVAGLLSKRRR